MRIRKGDQIKLKTFLKLFFVCLSFFVISFLYLLWALNYENKVKFTEEITNNERILTDIVAFNRHDMVIAVVACGDRFDETMTMLKSALMFSKSHLNFLIVAEDILIERFKEKLQEWKGLSASSFDFKVIPITFPTNEAEEWKNLFKPCAAQRLFLPDILKDVDSILYMDTDTLFLTPVESVWRHFHKMNSSQMAALAPEHEYPNVGWYNRFARHPYYGKLGVNSGVMLMNLTKMRAFKWGEYIGPIYKKFKLKITWGDQDIINIIFHYHPAKLYIYPCRYNFRPDHCMYTSVCKSAEEDGVAVLHGSRGFFHSEKQPVFRAIYQAVQEFKLGTDNNQEFLHTLETYLEDAKNSNCGHVKDIFMKNLKNYIVIEEEFICGWAAAITNVMLTFPFQKLSAYQILNDEDLFSASRQLVKKLEFKTVYRGVLPPLVHKSISVSGMFGVYYKLYNYLLVNNVQNAMYISGFTTGVLETSMMPFERVQTILFHDELTKKYKNTFDVIFKLKKEYGAKEFYRGFSISLFRNAFGSMLFFSFKQGSDFYFYKKRELSINQTAADFIQGGVIGASLTTILYPLTVLKLCAQKQIGGEFKSPLRILEEVISKKKSLRLFFRGGCINATRGFLSWGIINSSYEMFMIIIKM